MSSAYDQALRTAARWLAIGMSIPPIADIADRTGVLTAPSQLEAAQWVGFFARVTPFVAIGIAAAWLLRRHDRRDRTWFLAACALVLIGDAVLTGVRLPIVAGLLAVAFAFSQSRLAARLTP